MAIRAPLNVSNRTLRQIVHTSIGGTSARIRLSNAFGTKPITLQSVYLAPIATNLNVDTSKQKLVTFAGAQSVTIPAGGDVTSDSVTFSVPAEGNLAISFYVPGSNSIVTGHEYSAQINYHAAGNVSGKATLSRPSTAQAYWLISGLEVQNSAAKGAIVALGASITAGDKSVAGANHRWPNFLSQRLQAANLNWGVLNEGISGGTLLTDGLGQAAIKRFARDVGGQSNATWVVFADCPLNDSRVAKKDLGPQIIAGLQNIIVQAHAANLKIICATLTPSDGYGGWNSVEESGRLAYNAFVLGGNNGCDAVVDFDKAVRDPAQVSRLLPTDDSGDHIHPSDAGRQAIANAFDLSLFQ